ncbi:hypothetical protein B0T24DRAFT_638311 [Lasiosphaeria ovina]|uniref:Uncharacterized protein n=1 Tax=Lasiosphaeria ovina TaxID=92902 RepID=A0AAE0JXM2_9PEZI|nr:hypothetical protein B0T24DRAFT_638311 [Lasiosphaeria ovina]
MTSGHGRIPALGGTNPDYYAETASIMGHDAPSGPGRPGRHSHSHSWSHSHRPQPQQQQQQQQQYLSPPGGAAPYYQQPTYAPPTSGPGQAYYPPPPPQSLPSPQLGIIEDYDHGDIPPPKPPRPVSSHASLGGSPGGLLPSPGGSPSPSPGTSPSNKPTFGERLHQWSVKAGAPINKMANKLGSEAFWPSSMDLECDKAARILLSFCSKSPFPLSISLSVTLASL